MIQKLAHTAHCTVTEKFGHFTKTVGIRMTLCVCLFAQSKLFLCRETQSLVHSLVIYTPSTIIVHRQTHSLLSITISNPPSQSTDKHEDSVVGGDPDGDL